MNRFFKELKARLDRNYPSLEWSVWNEISDQISWADASKGIPGEFLVGVRVPNISQIPVRRVLYSRFSGEDYAKLNETEVDAFVSTETALMRVSATSPSLFQPSSNKLYTGKYGAHEICADSPICLRIPSRGILIEQLNSKFALVAYLELSTSGGIPADNIEILQWEEGHWVGLAPESLM